MLSSDTTAQLTSIDRVKQILALLGLLNVRVDEQGVGFGVDVLHHDLESIEATRLGDLNFSAEALDEVLVDDAVRRGKERENVGDEVPLVIIQAVVPVMQVLGQVDFFRRPEGRLGLLVHLPDLLWCGSSACVLPRPHGPTRRV